MNSAEAQKQQDERVAATVSKIKHKVIILSGKGGVGKSTVSVNVAYSLAEQGKKVGLLDVDIHGPSIAKMVGIEGEAILGSKDGYPKPIKVNENLYAITMASFTSSPDEPIIWRGPLKMAMIKQFLSDIDWPELDYLIIDSPPGTGDEPLSVVQIIGNVDGAIIVSTPQDVALLDARKTIKFSQKMNVPILGIVENMSTFICPHCGEAIDIFKGLGVQKAAKDYNIDILGNIPLDPDVVAAGDRGTAFVSKFKESAGAQVYKQISAQITKKIEL